MSTLTCNPNLEAHSQSSSANMTSDGTNTYLWDAEDRLIQITYPGSGNNSQFTVDPKGLVVKIVENTASSSTSTKQFLWCSNKRSEERNEMGIITKKYFTLGQTNSGSSYFYLIDHLGSIREMTDTNSNIQAQYRYDPYGSKAKINGGQKSDFLYCGYYEHERSELLSTPHRFYNSTNGRWINRDPIGENGGINLYAYCNNEPQMHNDPNGLGPETTMGLPPQAMLALGLLSLAATLVPGMQPGMEELMSAMGKAAKEAGSRAEAALKALERARYKVRCNESPPECEKDPNNDCFLALWKLLRNMDCLNMRKAWDEKWLPGRHAIEIINLTRAIQKNIEQVKNACRIDEYM